MTPQCCCAVTDGIRAGCTDCETSEREPCRQDERRALEKAPAAANASTEGAVIRVSTHPANRIEDLLPQNAELEQDIRRTTARLIRINHTPRTQLTRRSHDLSHVRI